MRKRETRVIRVHLALGVHVLKFQSPRSLLQHLAIFQNRQALSLFCCPRHCHIASTCCPRSRPQSTSLPYPQPHWWPPPRPQLPGFADCAATTHLRPSMPPPAHLTLSRRSADAPPPFVRFVRFVCDVQCRLMMCAYVMVLILV
jgi:hypothetical protein